MNQYDTAVTFQDSFRFLHILFRLKNVAGRHTEAAITVITCQQNDILPQPEPMSQFLSCCHTERTSDGKPFRQIQRKCFKRRTCSVRRRIIRHAVRTHRFYKGSCRLIRFKLPCVEHLPSFYFPGYFLLRYKRRTIQSLHRSQFAVLILFQI